MMMPVQALRGIPRGTRQQLPRRANTYSPNPVADTLKVMDRPVERSRPMLNDADYAYSAAIVPVGSRATSMIEVHLPPSCDVYLFPLPDRWIQHEEE